MTKVYLHFTGFVFSILLVCFSCAKPPEVIGKKKIVKAKTDVHFIENVDLFDVLDLAVEENKLVFVNMHAAWCLPCQMMKEDVFSHKPTADFINKNFISYNVDAEKGNGPNLKLLFEVSQLPGLIFLNNSGKLLEKKEGAAYHSELVSLAQAAIDKECPVYND